MEGKGGQSSLFEQERQRQVSPADFRHCARRRKSRGQWSRERVKLLRGPLHWIPPTFLQPSCVLRSRFEASRASYGSGSSLFSSARDA
jgi:hypothetical protein